MANNFLKESSRKSSTRLNSTDTHRKTTNRQSQALMRDTKIETVQEKPITFQMPPKGCILEMLRALLFIVVIMTYLTCAVIHFIRTSDMMPPDTALAYAGVNVGISK